MSGTRSIDGGVTAAACAAAQGSTGALLRSRVCSTIWGVGGGSGAKKSSTGGSGTGMLLPSKCHLASFLDQWMVTRLTGWIPCGSSLSLMIVGIWTKPSGSRGPSSLYRSCGGKPAGAAASPAVKGAPWAWEVGPGTDGGTCGAIGSLDGAYSGGMSETRWIHGEVRTPGCCVAGGAELGGGDASACRASMRTC